MTTIVPGKQTVDVPVTHQYIVFLIWANSAGVSAQPLLASMTTDNIAPLANSTCFNKDLINSHKRDRENGNIE